MEKKEKHINSLINLKYDLHFSNIPLQFLLCSVSLWSWTYTKMQWSTPLIL